MISMDIALIGFGKVSYSLFKLIDSEDVNFITSTEGRSHDTIDRINKSNIEVCDSFSQAIEKSDIVISAVTPSQALNVLKRLKSVLISSKIDIMNR